MKIGLITRCKDEYFIEEFVKHYINEGIDSIYIIDDNSSDKSIYDGIEKLQNVTILYKKNIIRTKYDNKLYKAIRFKYDWIIYVDVDEFVTTAHSPSKTIREELISTFSEVDCIKIPWVMMSCNGVEESPKSILKTNTYRWNHDLRHVNKISKHNKFRCRYDQIEIKCIFKPKYFENIWDHHPKSPVKKSDLTIVDSVKNQPAELTPFYSNLREDDIASAYLLCYHYRIISVENCRNKLRNSKFYKKIKCDVNDLMSTDYPEIQEHNLRDKSLSRTNNSFNETSSISKFNQLINKKSLEIKISILHFTSKFIGG